MQRSQSIPTKQDFYDQFQFIDSLTNRSIAVRDIRKKAKRQSTTNYRSKVSEKKQLKELDECIALLRATKSFQKQNLRNKLFGLKNSESASWTPEQGRETIRKRRMIRNMLKDTLCQRSREEFHQYLSSSSHRLDPDLIQMTRRENIPISKENVTKVVDALQQKQPVAELPLKQNIQGIDAEPLVEGLTSIETEIQRQVKGKLRKAGLFLIEPQQKMNVNKQWKPIKVKQTSFLESRRQMEMLKDVRWQPASLSNSQIKRKPRVQHWRKTRQRTSRSFKELFSAVRTGQLSDVQVLVGRYSRDALRARDENGNNLLHECARLNKTLIFQWILRTSGIEALLEKNADGQTPIVVATKLGHREVLNYVPRSLI